MVSPSRSISGFCQKQTKQQWPNPTCSCSHVWGVKQGPALQGPAKFPSSLMGNSIACLVPEQETKPIQTRGHKTYRKCLPLWIQILLLAGERESMLHTFSNSMSSNKQSWVCFQRNTFSLTVCHQHRWQTSVYSYICTKISKSASKVKLVECTQTISVVCLSVCSAATVTI